MDTGLSLSQSRENDILMPVSRYFWGMEVFGLKKEHQLIMEKVIKELDGLKICEAKGILHDAMVAITESSYFSFKEIPNYEIPD